MNNHFLKDEDSNFKIGNVEYAVVKDQDCISCVFYNNSCEKLPRPPCKSIDRNDRSNVNFKVYNLANERN